MTNERFDKDFWEERWAQALRDQPDAIASRPANAHLLADISDLPPGRALDAGCGHGAETLWLATSGWRVTAVDFSATALEQARSRVRALGPEVAERIEWIEADLAIWTPQFAQFDLVISLYVHVSDSVAAMVQRLASGVTPGGRLFLVGHRPIDPATGAPTPAASQTQISIAEVLDALDPNEWHIAIAEERARATTGSGVDAVVSSVKHL